MNKNDEHTTFDPAYTRRVIEPHNLYSVHLQEERTIKVCLPPHFDRTRSYPVLYCHDGNEFFTHGRISTIANQLVAEGKLEPLLIVAIAVNMPHRRDDYALDGARHAAFQQFVMEECLPFVEARYPVDATRRSMAGSSLGAVVSLSIALRHPQQLNRLIMLSGAFYPVVQSAVAAEASLRDLNCFMVVGRQETALETKHGTYNLLALNQQMRDKLRIRGANVTYHEADGEHVWGFWQRQLPDALVWLNGLA